MNAAIGWVLAVAALVAGYTGYGWPGVLMALSVVVFWLLLQFNRAVRVMRKLAQRPKGSVASVVMLQSKLQLGMRLAEVMKLSGSFGVAVEADQPPDRESFAWTDAGGDALQITLKAGKVSAWQLQRAERSEAAAPGA